MSNIIFFIFAVFFSMLALAEVGMMIKGKEWQRENKNLILFLQVLGVGGTALWIILYTQMG